MVTALEAVFRESEPGVFTRKLAGSEAMCSLFSEGNGRTHLTFSTDVKLAKELSRIEVHRKVKRAMIRLRHFVPAIGCTVSRLYPKQEFQFRYEVPKSVDEACRWANSVVVSHDEPLSFKDAHDRITETVWWKASDGRYTHLLYLRPELEDHQRWTFTLSVHHSNADGRSSWMCFDKILFFLEDEVLGRAAPLEDLKWGEETHRLPAPPESIPSIAKNGVPDEFPDPDIQMPIPPDGYAPFLYPFKAADGVEDGTIGDRLNFTKEETTRLHEACKANGRTVTQAASALAALTNVEWILNVAAETDDLYDETMDVFEKSTSYQSALNVVDIRFLLPASYRTLDSEHRPPLNSIDGFPLNFPFEPYKRMVAVNRKQRTVSHVGDKTVFWNELVKDVAEAWSRESRTLNAFRIRAAIGNKLAADPNVDLSSFVNAAPVISSCGDMTRLNILERFRPSASNKALVVEAINYSTHITQPSLLFCFLEYDGVFSFVVLANKKFWTKEQLDMYMTLLKGWTGVVLQ